jgi:Kinesin motor domain
VQESLGGNAKTMLICNISPAVAFAEETQITLEFARGAKELKNRVCTAGWPLVTSSSCGFQPPSLASIPFKPCLKQMHESSSVCLYVQAW